MDIFTLVIIICAIGAIIYLDRNPETKTKVKEGLKTYYQNLKTYFDK
tara:strand:+ start:333 stop:473 length:141 start_codon:yes stop_codon:yes gene_type:complete